MFHTTGLDELIFKSGRWEADRLVVVSGYIGPNPVLRAQSLPFDVTVVYGMVSDGGVSQADHDFFSRITAERGNVEVRYSIRSEIHSKLYVWGVGDRPTIALTGSANFTWPGLNTPGREILMEVSGNDLASACSYAVRAVRDSVSCLDAAVMPYVVDGPGLASGASVAGVPPAASQSVEISLLNSRTGDVPDRSGINWGCAEANVHPDDAYLPVTIASIRTSQGMFPPKQSSGNSPVELLWDDGTVMTGYLEGSQEIDGRKYPKQLASHPEKNILGRYLKRRLGVPAGRKVSLADLDRYGRRSVILSLLGPGRYFVDFRS
jgi:hypothetical protein